MDASDHVALNFTTPHTAELDALADRLREVRRRLSRSNALAHVLEGDFHRPQALRAAQRLDAAVRRLSESEPARAVARRSEKIGWPLLIRVVEQRAGRLEQMLREQPAPICSFR